jgi:hypothetical protein
MVIEFLPLWLLTQMIVVVLGIPNRKEEGNGMDNSWPFR